MAEVLFSVLDDLQVTAQPQPSSKNKTGAKPGSSKPQIFFLQTSGSLSDHGAYIGAVATLVRSFSDTFTV